MAGNSNVLNPTISEADFDILLNHFYFKKVKKSPNLLKYFKGKCFELLVKKMGTFIYQNLSSIFFTSYGSFEYLAQIHKNLRISDQDYDIFKGLLIISMRELKMNENIINLLLIQIEKYRKHIVYYQTFEEIFPNFEGGFEIFIIKLTEKLKESAILRKFFEGIHYDKAYNHQRRIFNYLTNNCLVIESVGKFKIFHEKLGISSKHLLELKNIIFNYCLEIAGIDQNNPILNQNLINLHFGLQKLSFILSTPNPYEFIEPKQINFNQLREIFIKFITKDQKLVKLFEKWEPERLKRHCVSILDYLFQISRNKILINDLIPIHCRKFITKLEFKNLGESLKNALIYMELDQNIIDKILTNYDYSFHNICREKSILDLIGGQNTINLIVDSMYVQLLGAQDTKTFFAHSNTNNLVFKLKIFFNRILDNKITYDDLIDLKVIHHKMDIKDKQFDFFLKSLEEALGDLQIQSELINLILEKFRKIRCYITSK